MTERTERAQTSCLRCTLMRVLKKVFTFATHLGQILHYRLGFNITGYLLPRLMSSNDLGDELFQSVFWVQ